MIAVNQDPLGEQGRLVRKDDKGAWQVWAGALANGCHAAVLLNTGNAPAPAVPLTWAALGKAHTARLHVRDLWQGKDLGAFVGGFNASVPVAHDNVMVKVCGS